ncbi:MAG: M16 family metallopeptidase [Limisphaerales bacterium]
MFRYLLLPWLAVLHLSATAAEIPGHPDKLTYPPLTYEPPNPADYRVQLRAGPVAYVIEDRELPLVNFVIYVRTGKYLEPTGKEGLAAMTGYLLARGGTATKAAEELEERLAYLAANLNTGVGDTQGSLGLNLLSKDLDEGFSLAREVLTAPRFQDNKVALYRQQTLQELQQRNDDSADIEAREQSYLAFGTNFWSNRLPTGASINAITADDLRAFHRRWFHPANFVVAVNGDFAKADMVARLETFFSAWPFTGDPAQPVPTDATLAAPGLYLYDKDVNQGRVSLQLPGVLRDHPDFLAIRVMNDILGGGGFTSRIMNRVRSDEGLAYSAGSAFPGGVHFPLPFEASFQSKSRTVAYATSIVLEEMKRIAAEPVAAQELETSRRSFIDTFPRLFSTKTQVATRFADDEFTGRFAKDPTFYKTYRDRVAAVTAADVQRVAQEHLDPSRVVILVVGQKEEVLKGHPDHAVKLPDLAGGQITTLPTRDPLTLEPRPAAN